MPARWQVSCDDPALTRLVHELYPPMLIAAGSTDPTITYRLTVPAGDRAWEVPRDSAYHLPDLPDPLAGYMDRRWQLPPQRVTTIVPHGPLAIAALDLIRSSTFGLQDQPLTRATMPPLAYLVAAVPCYGLRTRHLAEACTAVHPSIRRGRPCGSPCRSRRADRR